MSLIEDAVELTTFYIWREVEYDSYRRLISRAKNRDLPIHISHYYMI